jgi:spore germination protein
MVKTVIGDDMDITNSLDKNIKYIKDTFKGADDIIFREFKSGNKNCFMVYTDNIVSSDTIENAVLTNIMIRSTQNYNINSMNEDAVSVGETKKVYTFEEVFDAVLLGDTAIFTDSDNSALVISTKNWPSRGVPKAENEAVFQGPNDAFTEQGSTNTVLVRRRIRDTALKVKRMHCGKRSKTDVAVLYLKDVAKDELVQKVITQLENIDIDAVFDCGYVQQLIEKNIVSPFPQLQMTERPDKAASAVLEGRVVILVDNSPFAIMVPAGLNMFFQASEDYYERWEIMSLLRILRFIAAFISYSLPGLYIALTVFEPNMIPAQLALKIAEGRANVPFPTLVEVLIMELAFELLREACIRLPSSAGSALGIVGGIIIGQAAVEAGIVGPAVVIIAATAGICSFAIPNTGIVASFRLIKYFVIAASAFFGMFGFFMAQLLILSHLSMLESYGMPYLFPFCSAEAGGYSDLKDSLIRVPLIFMKKRPAFAKQETDGGKREEK